MSYRHKLLLNTDLNFTCKVYNPYTQGLLTCCRFFSATTAFSFALRDWRSRCCNA